MQDKEVAADHWYETALNRKVRWAQGLEVGELARTGRRKEMVDQRA